MICTKMMPPFGMHSFCNPPPAHELSFVVQSGRKKICLSHRRRIGSLAEDKTSPGALTIELDVESGRNPCKC
jgi:hypothetical protein